MEIYEALKNGASKQELLDSFKKQLDAAYEQLTANQEEEKRKEKERILQQARDYLIDSVIGFTEALTDTHFELNEFDTLYDLLEEKLIKFEQENKEIFNKKAAKAKISDNDLNIINEYLLELGLR